jgi:hypothetical protein
MYIKACCLTLKEKMENRRPESIKRTITLVKEGFPFKFYLGNSSKRWNHKRLLVLFPKTEEPKLRSFVKLVNLAESLIAQPIDKSSLNLNSESELPYQDSNSVSRRVLIEDTYERAINFINNIINNLEQNKGSVIFYEKYQCSIYLGNDYHTDIIHKHNERIYVDQKRFSMTFNFSVLELVSLILGNEDKLLLLHEIMIPEVFSNQNFCVQEIKTYPCIIPFRKLKQGLYMIVSQED